MPRPSLLNRGQLNDELAQLNEWSAVSSATGAGVVVSPGEAGDSEGVALVSEFEFKNFTVAFGFMASVATVAERMGHHPDWSNSYNRVKVELSTHDVGGVTSLDVELAHEVSDLAELFRTQ